jgi:hypothetical protein
MAMTTPINSRRFVYGTVIVLPEKKKDSRVDCPHYLVPLV